MAQDYVENYDQKRPSYPCGFDQYGNPYGFDEDEEYFNQEAERRITSAHPNINPNQFKITENEI